MTKKSDEPDNEALALAASGLSCAFHVLSTEARTEVLSALSDRFVRLVDSLLSAVKRNPRSPRRPAHSGLLAYEVGAALLGALGDGSCRRAMLEPRLLSAMFRFLLILKHVAEPPASGKDQEGKDEVPSEDQVLLNAAATQALLILSVLMRPASSETTIGSSWKEVISGAEATTDSVLSKKKKRAGGATAAGGLSTALRGGGGSEGEAVKAVEASSAAGLVSVLRELAGDKGDCAAAVAAGKVLDLVEGE